MGGEGHVSCQSLCKTYSNCVGYVWSSKNSQSWCHLKTQFANCVDKEAGECGDWRGRTCHVGWKLVSDWGEWSECIFSNDELKRTRTRTCNSGPSGTNGDCSAELTEHETCPFANPAVLLLSTRKSSNVPMLVSLDGKSIWMSIFLVVGICPAALDSYEI